MKTLTDSLRDAIVKSGMTHYRIGLESGVAPAQIDRFVSGERDLRLESASRIAQVLRLELKARKRN